MKLEKPDPPVVLKVTHFSIELSWDHVKVKLSQGERVKYTLQEFVNTPKREWTTVYSGYGSSHVIDNLEPASEYMYRLCMTGLDNQRSEYSSACVVRTTKEPLNGEALHRAINLDKKADIEKILDSTSGHRLLDVSDKFGNLPLMVSIIKNNFEVFQLLVEHGADVNAQNESLKTALMIAAFYGRLNFIRELRTHGASYDLKDISGMTPVFYAIDGGHLHALEWMLNDGADVNIVAYNGWTPLLRAASVNSSPDIARLLIHHGAEIDALDKKNKNALLIATINGNVPFVKVLLENGANFRFKNNFGKTLYDLAISMDRKPLVKYFEEYMEKNNVKLY